MDNRDVNLQNRSSSIGKKNAYQGNPVTLYMERVQILFLSMADTVVQCDISCALSKPCYEVCLNLWASFFLCADFLVPTSVVIILELCD